MLGTVVQGLAGLREEQRSMREDMLALRQEHAQDRLELQSMVAAIMAMTVKKVEPTGTGSTTTSAAASAAAPPAAQSTPAPQPKSLKPRDNTSSKPAALGYSKHPLLQEVLERLAKENKIRKLTMGVDVYDLTNDSAVTKRVFKFTKQCITDEHWDVLLKPKEETEEGRNALKSACEQIQCAVNEQLNKRVPFTSRMQHTVAGFGNRIKEAPGGGRVVVRRIPGRGGAGRGGGRGGAGD
jgi:hypothetical protein